MSTKSSSQSCAPFIHQRTLKWTQGMAIALGVPVLILPSIGYFAMVIGGLAIIAWMLSVFQGYMQNIAYAELASRYPQVCGIPGAAQAVFKDKTEGEYSLSKFIGGFSAWGYFFAWSTVLAIYCLLIGDYLIGMVPAFADTSPTLLSFAIGLIIYGGLIIVNYSGVTGGAMLSYFLAALSLIPLILISVSGLLSEHFQITNITNHWLPADWVWSPDKILLFLGIMAMAQWSACGWETAAIYTPLYKNPKNDTVKALFGCGFICLITYSIVQAACTGALGLDGIAEAKYSPMLTLARMTMGGIGPIVAIIMLMASMVLIIQTAFLGSSSAMAGMADEGNLPAIFGKRNKHDVPIAGMISISVINLALILIGSPTSILAASSLGYVIANGVPLYAYVKASRDFDKLSTEEKADVFRAPRGWKYVAFLFGFINIPLFCIGIVYLNVTDPTIGVINTVAGLFLTLLFIPLWLYTKATASKPIEAEAPAGEII